MYVDVCKCPNVILPSSEVFSISLDFVFRRGLMRYANKVNLPSPTSLLKRTKTLLPKLKYVWSCLLTMVTDYYSSTMHYYYYHSYSTAISIINLSSSHVFSVIKSSSSITAIITASINIRWQNKLLLSNTLHHELLAYSHAGFIFRNNLTYKNDFLLLDCTHSKTIPCQLKQLVFITIPSEKTLAQS